LPAGFNVFSRLYHSNDEGKRRTEAMLEQYKRDKAAKEQMIKDKEEKYRQVQEAKYKEKTKAIFVVRTLEPNKGAK
jgi:hypothetical protein